jgi:cobalamin biosynthesis protein CobT
MIGSHATEKIAKIISQNFNLKVEIFGDQAYTNGKRMVLPNIPEIPENYKDAYLGLILHEAGHVKFTKNLKMTSSQHALFYNVFEDVRVEQCIEKKFDGAKQIFKQLYEWAEKTHPTPHDEDNVLTTITRHIIRSLRFKQNLLTAIEQPTYDKISHLVRKTTSSEDSSKVALQVAEALGYTKDENMENAEKDFENSSNDLKDKSKELKDKKDEMDELKKEIKKTQNEIDKLKGDSSGSGASGSSDSGTDDDSDDFDGDGDSDSDSDSNDDLSDSDIDKLKELKNELKEKMVKKSLLQREINSLKELLKELKKIQKLSKNTIVKISNTFVKESDLDDSIKQILKELVKQVFGNIEQENIATGTRRHIPLTTKFDVVEIVKPNKSEKKGYIDKLKSQINLFSRIVDQALYAKKKSAYSYSKDEGTIDTRALYSYKVNKNTQIFYQQKDKNVRDIAVEIVIDLSGSMAPNIQQVKSASFVISETLTNLNINHEIIGFSTAAFSKSETFDFDKIQDRSRFNRFEKLHHFVIKAFNNDDNSGITNIQSHGNNVDGESLLWATNRLLKRTEKRKIIFVLSDGFPASYSDTQTLYDDLKKTVKLVESAGVQVLALGINGDHCKEFYTEHIELKNNFHTDFCKEIFKYLIQKQSNTSSISPARFDQIIKQALR